MSIERREFLKKASMLTSGILLAGTGSTLAGCAGTKLNSAVNDNFGLQLWTLRDDLPKNAQDVLDRKSVV